MLRLIVPCALVTLVGACTLFVDFSDRKDTPLAEEDSGTTTTPTVTATSTATTPPPPKDSGPPDVVNPSNRCTGHQDGYQFDINNAYARCCGEKETDLTKPQNCGGCGITCGANQPCEFRNGTHYYCTNCANTGGSPSCWSGCCSPSYAPEGLCSASKCSPAQCNDAMCQDRGMSCFEPAGSSFYCFYP